MQDVLNFISHEVRIEEFIGVRHERANTPDNKKKPDEETLKKEKEQAAKLMETLDRMSYKELKEYAGVKGNIKREKIYELIHLSK
jgi:hypothetical protein